MNFNLFVVPFVVGLVYIILYVVIRFFIWIMKLEKEEKRMFRKAFFSFKLFSIIKEIFLESLIHRKIFKTNPVLGFMHASFAFGWFMLILVGTIESKMHSPNFFSAPYNPIFFQFFVHDYSDFKYASQFTFIMDFILSILLVATLMALAKRLYSSIFGMKRTTKQRPVDKIVITALWLIFPLRFLAESFTAGIYNNGGFLTQTFGNAFASFLPLESIELPAWWAYSLALFAFFLVLPFTRYMHIPTELLLIAMKKAGLRENKVFNSVSDVAVHSCSRCGICIDACQLNSSLDKKNIVPAYFLRTIRDNELDVEAAEYCMMCGRCEAACPVGIETTMIRASKKFEERKSIAKVNIDYVGEIKSKTAKVAYYAGCAGHLTPSVYRSMIKIFKNANVDYTFLDEADGICCGKPMMQNGDYEGAEKMISLNKKLIENSGATVLVTSCPFCLSVFKDEYKLDIRVIHHSQYIQELLNEGKIKVSASGIKTYYHDPCELGRSCGIVDEPRQVINKASNLINKNYVEKLALCCGGSIATTKVDMHENVKLNLDVLAQFEVNDYEMLVTGCPMCKKTFATNSSRPVIDIAELVVNQMAN
ncbi:MAG: (Fe-S)-binding protein [Bacteroidota bacterium]